jgi:hypothetical protein
MRTRNSIPRRWRGLRLRSTILALEARAATFADPQVGKQVLVLFGNWRHSGTISQILPLSEVYGGTQGSFLRERVATQIARIRFSPDTEPPALGSSVSVHMYYSDLVARLAGLLVRLFGLG